MSHAHCTFGCGVFDRSCASHINLNAPNTMLSFGAGLIEVGPRPAYSTESGIWNGTQSVRG